MKKTFENFKMMSLRPALYNGTVFETDVSFNDASAFRVGIKEARALNMICGDTVRIRGRVCGTSDCEYIEIYMCGDALTDFISKHGTFKITGEIGMKLELIYAVYENTEFSIEPEKEEITAFRLIETFAAEKDAKIRNDKR